MSQENVEIVERVLGALRLAIESYSANPEALTEATEVGNLAPELQAALALVDPAAEWHPPREDPDTADQRGLDAIVAYLKQWLDAWEYWRVEPESVIDAGDKVVVLSRSAGKGRASGIELAPFDSAHVVTVTGGRIVRIDGFYDRDDALAAAGIRR
jgi:ketosteroid isomerase-like protein